MLVHNRLVIKLRKKKKFTGDVNMKEKKNKNRNINIGLVLAIFVLLPAMAGTANAETYKIFVDSDYGFYRIINLNGSAVPYENKTLSVNLEDTVIWINDATPDQALTIVSKEGLFGDVLLRWNYQQFDYTFNYKFIGTGTKTLEFYLKEYPRLDMKIVVNPIYIDRTPPNPLSWSNDYTKDGRSQFEIPVGTMVKFNITTNYDVDKVEFDPFRTIGLPDLRNVYGLYNFEQAGFYNIYINAIGFDGKKTGRQWDVLVYIATATPTPTPTYTPTVYTTRVHNIHVGQGTYNVNCDRCHGFPPIIYSPARECVSCHPSMTPTPVVTITPVQTTVGPTPTVAVTVTATATTVPTVTGDTSPGHPEEYYETTQKRAILEVTNKIDRSDSGAIITVSVRNTGDDTARFVNFSSSIPSELGAELVSGADWNGNELIWKGDIETGKGHDIIYKVKPAKIDINIPVKVTYVKDSITAGKVISKAAASGIRAESVAVDPQDLQVIYYVILITKAILPGFEVVFGLAGIGVIYVLGKIKK